MLCLFQETSFNLNGCQSDAQEWLQEVRQKTDNFQRSVLFQQPSVRVSVGEENYDRCPYEEIRLDYGNTRHEYHIRIGEDKKIVWCVMCFGREANLQPHLERSMCLSYGLRHKLAPILKDQYGISFANVMFVTEESLDEASFKALSLFWSMKVVPLPEVHPDRIAGVSWHLKDDHIRPEHVFLKYYTWTMPSEIAIISDVDVLITNPDKLAAGLAEYIKEGELKELQKRVGVSCMCRVKSQVGFGLEFKPVLVQQKKKRFDNLSYCFAIVTPDKEAAERYKEELADNSGRIGKLSDQDYFSYYNREAYILLYQNLIAFFSWWNHFDLMEKLIQFIIQLSVDVAPSDQIRSWWMTEEFATYLFDMFGAVHCSSAFDVVKVERTKDKFVKEFTARGNHTWKVKFRYPLGHEQTEGIIKVHRTAWAKTICWNMNVLCRKKSMEIVEKLHENILEYTGYKDPEPWMAKALFILLNSLKRKGSESWLSQQDDATTKIKGEASSSRAKPENVGDDAQKAIKTAPWKQKREESKAASSKEEHPWKKKQRK